MDYTLQKCKNSRIEKDFFAIIAHSIPGMEEANFRVRKRRSNRLMER
jgi:hypothetical protein